jgi:O-antigen/teichoic acid export membrane protein
MLALVAFPLLAGLAAVAPALLPLVLGPQWAGAAFATQVLCGVGALKALVCSIGTVFVGKGRPDLELKLNAFGVVKLTLMLLIGVRWGVEGVALAYLASSLFGAPIQQHVANRLIGLPWRAYLGAIAAPTGSAAAMLLVLMVLRAAGLPPLAFVVAAVPLGALTYVAALQALGVDWRGLLGLVTERRRRPRGDQAQHPEAAA